MIPPWYTVGLLSSLVWGMLLRPLPAGALCLSDLSATIEAIANRPELRHARLGLQVETLTGETILSREGDRFFVPASTLKLLTTAAVLTEFGSEYTLRTSVLSRHQDDGTTLLEVIGQGDPSFNQADLTALSRQLQEQGIRRVNGLYGNDHAFPGPTVNPNWEWEDVQAGYGAPANALILNENEIGLSLIPQAIGEPLQIVWDDPSQRLNWAIENHSTTVAVGEPEFVSVGRDLGHPVLQISGQLIAGTDPETTSIAVPNPGEVFLEAFRSSLIKQGIEVQGTRLTSVATDDWTELAAVESPRLADLLTTTNQDSNNIYAEALLKQLGRQTVASTDTTVTGIQWAIATLADLGVDPEAIVMVDGSGLARKNLITPEAMVDVLQGMAQSPYASVYRDSLAIAGVSGTLRNRLRESPAAGRLYGKSGAISRNFALAGYLQPEEAPPLVFSLFLNNINESGRVARPIIDEIVLHIFALESCRLPMSVSTSPHNG